MARKLTTLGKKKLVIAALEDIKAHDIVAIDVRKVTSIFDWIVVATADSARQTKALSRHLKDALKEAASLPADFQAVLTKLQAPDSLEARG